jgi:DNA-binding NarL/FixJ family response regulator
LNGGGCHYRADGTGFLYQHTAETVVADLTPTQLAVLDQLVVGATRQVIAERLHLSERTIDSRVAEIRRLLGVTQRICLGALAVRHWLVDRQAPVSSARARRPGDDWVAPTTRQRRLVRRLAGGATVDVASREMGLSARTLRHDLTRLAAANGAGTPTHAGALYEALDWTSEPEITTASTAEGGPLVHPVRAPANGTEDRPRWRG